MCRRMLLRTLNPLPQDSMGQTNANVESQYADEISGRQNGVRTLLASVRVEVRLDRSRRLDGRQ